MNSKADLIAFTSDKPAYPQSKSKWFGKARKDKFRLVFSFYSPDGCEISMPIASMSAYLKREYPDVELVLDPVLIASDPIGYTPEKFAQRIKTHNADLIAFSIMSPHWPPMEAYFAELKQRLPDLPILIGGYQAMLSQEETISNPNIDYICVGDGEYAIANAIDHLRGAKEGPADGNWEKLSDGSVYETDPHQIGDIQALPFPDYDIFEKEDGFDSVNSSIFGPKGVFVLPVMTGRGCPYRCTYCCNTPILEGWKTKKTFLRKYDPETMVEELIRLRDKYNVGYFEFWDELFLSNLKFVRAFLEIYKERLGLPFSINSRVEVMSEEFCNKVAEAGCHTIWFGIESGDEEYRSKMLGRKMTNKQVIEAAINCKKAGINRLTFNIVGMPLETATNMRRTLELNQKIKPEFFFFFPYIPLRGTPLYKTSLREGLLQDLKRNIHYLSSSNDKEFTLNLKEQPELLSQEEYSKICFEMLAFQDANNRLSYTDGDFEQGSEPAHADVLDKSFVLTEEAATITASVKENESPEMITPAAPIQQHRSVLSGLVNLFRS